MAAVGQKADSSQAEKQTTAEVTTAEPLLLNEFAHLLSADELVQQLRGKYGIKGSVLLSKTLWQILTSYSNQQQAQDVWYSTLSQLSDSTQSISAAQFSVVNARYNAGQLLINFTHGMDTKNWNENRGGIVLKKSKLSDFFALSDDLTIYFNLTDIWQILLADIASQENIQWHEVFADSLDLFVETESEPESTAEAAAEIPMDFFKQLSAWQNSGNKLKQLAQLMPQIEFATGNSRYLYESIIRFELNKSAQQYLATSLSWFAVAEQLYLYKDTVSTDDVGKINAFIEENDAWFLSKEQQLMALNKELPQWLELSFHELKAHYTNTTAVDLQQMPNIYQMLETKLQKYMESPFRQKIRKDLEVCLNISEEFAPFPQQPIDDKQFKGCINDMVVAATSEAKIRELSGSLTKIDTDQALDRALQLPAWQIINIMYATIADGNCLNDTSQLVNPLEWTLAAESLLWFADRWPAYMQRYKSQTLIAQIVKQGEQLIKPLPCVNKSKNEILDAKYIQIIQSWQNVKTQIKQLAVEFNKANLSSGSDLDLLENIDAQSNYRVEDVKIEACDALNSCGVHVQLESSRAIFGLFPNHLLVADQLKLGKLKICYDNVGWQNRRAASTHLDNDSVANYSGNFSFTLKGYYQQQLVFERKMVDQQEYLYLFAENTESVLNMACPLSLVGKKISTKLERGTFGLVPNRLTFLTASRADESKILTANWSKGEEWSDKIITDAAEIVTENPLGDLSPVIQTAYQQKAAELQNTIYSALLDRISNPTETQRQLKDSFQALQRSTKLFTALNYLLQMDVLMLNDDLHEILFGNNKIPDSEVIANFYARQVNISSLVTSIDENLQSNKEKWNALADLRSNSHVKNILFQLKSMSR
ncbi:MAG TPA: hypothetical protein ENJ41_01210 [Oceanospirillales bacterium]|nr:hypothetical protein [Oceanospirillales bacterium]